MGIVEAELASFELSAFESCHVERNSDGTIHLHLDDVRIELSEEEFDQFGSVVQSAKTELEDLKENDGTHDGSA